LAIGSVGRQLDIILTPEISTYKSIGCGWKLLLALFVLPHRAFLDIVTHRDRLANKGKSASGVANDEGDPSPIHLMFGEGGRVSANF
jgi:hypothetical protein